MLVYWGSIKYFLSLVKLCIGGLWQLPFRVRNVSDFWIYITFAFCKVYNDLGSFSGHIITYRHGECEDLLHRLLLSCSAQSLKWSATVSKAKLRFPVRSWFFLRQHLSPHLVWTFLHLDTRWRGVSGFTLWPTIPPRKEYGQCVPMHFFHDR